MSNKISLFPQWSFEELWEVLMFLDSKHPITKKELYKKVVQLITLGFDDKSILLYIKTLWPFFTDQEIIAAIAWARQQGYCFDLQKRLKFEEDYNPLRLKLLKGKKKRNRKNP